ncbi:MAG: MoaD/ThiS family protein [Halioglobus sp.]|nr:MoaD/ThiS family protein [Halioglobus sp.]
MLKVLFFASVKEQLDCAALDVEWREAVGDLDALQAYLGAERGPQWREVLGQANMVRAVNQSVASDNCRLRDGDEVAFFPPVTGG